MSIEYVRQTGRQQGGPSIAGLYHGGGSGGGGGPGGSTERIPPQDRSLIPATVPALDGEDTGITISFTPTNGCNVDVEVNGVNVELGDGVKTKECYFSSDGGTTALTIAGIISGATLFWNGAIAGYGLDAATDKVSFLYLTMI